MTDLKTILRALIELPAQVAQLREDVAAIARELSVEAMVRHLTSNKVRASALLIGSTDDDICYRGSYASWAFSLSPGESRWHHAHLHRTIAPGAHLIAFNAEIRGLKIGDRLCDVGGYDHFRGGQVAVIPHEIKLGMNVSFEIYVTTA